MLRNLKALALAALAAFAFTALGTGSAAASGEKFHAGQAHTMLHAAGTNNQVLVTTGGTVTCTGTTWTSTTTEVTPGAITAENVSYTGCTMKTIFGNLAVSSKPGSCDFVFTADTSQPTHLHCPPGVSMAFVAPGCTITFGAQTFNGVTYSNNGSHLNINWNVTNLVSHATDLFCSAAGLHNHGTFTGTTTVKGSTTAGVAVAVSYG